MAQSHNPAKLKAMHGEDNASIEARVVSKPRRKVTIEDMHGTRVVELPDAPFPCFRCDRVLQNQTNEQDKNWPDDACIFTTSGNYGSTVFDEFDGAKLEINICDACLVEGQKAGKIGYLPGIPKRVLKKWEGE